MNNIRPFKNITPTIGENSYIDEAACIIGDVVVGQDCSIWPMVAIRGDVNYIRIGDRTNIQDGSVLHVTHKGPLSPQGGALHIGSNVTVGHGAVIHACTIEDECLIGMGSVVLDGAIIKQGAMVGAGSVVSPGKELEGGYLYVGTPARKARELKQKEKDFLLYSAEHYVKLKNEYL
ncbi:MAG: gamma carbonic anhydrase family protein [endosymbiont of Galathealinum brachiosum]|uniref:Gamma carbonic anhydrase family protein n=1 Tax=endosymbiont of Galathealinum brachiosum TaxID=2200906 RepID=A0A370DFI7_9GAMM|nr:MAG: gamma carbonic anhydrase family protein [endosymbiont of Galathealinum brachiosum]